ncbi:MAG: glycosyltransferase [Chloroflexi bacterium]|nr:glycosyltransferase [Chloroflexota bacterium]
MPSSLRVTFLVNGGPDSAADIRASGFARWLGGDAQCRLLRRGPHKLSSVRAFLEDLAVWRPHVVYVMGMAYSGALAALLARLRWRLPYVLDTGDLVYQLLHSRGGVPQPLLLAYRALEALTVRRARAVVVRGSRHRDLLLAQGLNRVTLLPDGVDTEHSHPVAVGELRASLGLAGRFTVGILGSLVWSPRHRFCYGWDLVEALAHLRDLPVHGLIVGDGDGTARLESRARELLVADRLRFFGHVPHADLPRYLCLMDVCLSTQSNDPVGQARTTGKLPEYLACGRYVVATDVGEAHTLLRDVGSLLPYEGVRDDSYPPRLAAHIRWLYEHPQELSRAAAGPELARQRLDYRVLAPRLRALLLDLFPKDQRPETRD